MKDHKLITEYEGTYGGGFFGAIAPTPYRTQIPYTVAQIAIDLAKNWGMVLCADDGEDSAGRSQKRVATPQEVVGRACNIAAGLWAEFEARGWLMDVPDPKPKPTPTR